MQVLKYKSWQHMRLYGVTGSTQGADVPLIRATHVFKTKIEYIYM